MTVEQFERRLACALGIAIWVHLTRDELYGLWAIGGVVLCCAWAYFPAMGRRKARRPYR